MMELIDRQEVLEIAMSYCSDDDGSCSKAGHDIREMLDEIEALPTINTEVRHGRWIETKYNPVGDTMYCDCNCSNCNFEITREKGRYPKFCENCGVSMDGGIKNERY